MRKYVRFAGVRVFGAPVQLHWSVFVVAGGLLLGSIAQPLHALVGIASYFGMIFLHEAGHAYIANYLGCKPLRISLTCIHGECEYIEPYDARDDYLIAWGGAVAQALVAIPLVVLDHFYVLSSFPYFGPIVGFLGYISMFMIAVNLAPAKGLDGAKAWKLIPHYLRSRHRQAQVKKTKQPTLRRVK